MTHLNHPDLPHHTPGRRAFLRQAAAAPLFSTPLTAGALPLGLSLLAADQAQAQAAGTGYKALVCIFLAGGNDAYNTVLPTSSEAWAHYAAARASSELVLGQPGTPASSTPGATVHQRLGGVLPISPLDLPGGAYALHPVMTAARDLFAARRLAVVPNVGALIQPTAKADYLARRVPQPAKLFSHNDQQAMVQAFAGEGAQVGWGGRLADLFMARNTRAELSAVTLTDGAVWVAGRQARSYQLAPTGIISVGSTDGRLVGTDVAYQQLLKVMRGGRSDSLIAQDHAAVSGRAIGVQGFLRDALPAVGAGPWGTAGAGGAAADPLLQYTDPVTGVREANPLAQQLQAVSRMVAARSTLGLTRQVFYVTLDGFDTHNGQAARQATLLARLSHALGYFDRTLTAMGVADQVTTFTMSEFGRSFAANGDGTDHGWGSHALVMGGAVRGGRFHGRFPTYGGPLGGTGANRTDFDSPDQLRNGVLLPQVSVDQYGATLGRWFGASDSTLLEIFPNLTRFDASARQLGFMA